MSRAPLAVDFNNPAQLNTDPAAPGAIPVIARKPEAVFYDKPHLFRYVPFSPIHYSKCGRYIRLLMLNDAGEFRGMFISADFLTERFQAMQARIYGRTRFIGARCPDCGGREYFAHPITFNINNGGRRFAAAKCTGCDAHRMAKHFAMVERLTARYEDLLDSCTRYALCRVVDVLAEP